MPTTAETAILSSTEQRQYVTRSGWGTAAELANAALASGRPVVVLAQGRESFREAAALCRLFNPELSSADWALKQPLWLASQLDLAPIRNGRPDWPRYMAAFYGLSMHQPKCLVAGVDSLCLRYMPHDYFQDRTLELAPGQDFPPELIIEQALEWGYTRSPMVTAPGELARRGDILDIFPPGYVKPCRLEFFGDTIDEIRLFDAETQRSLENLDQLVLLPGSPAPSDPAGIARAKAQLNSLLKAGRLTENEEYLVRKRLDQGGQEIMPGLIYDKASFFEDWLPQNTLWLMPGDSAEALRNARASLKETLEADDALLQQPASLALRRANQPVPWNSFQCVLFERLELGVAEKGISLPERSIGAFSDLFSQAEERDRPWQTLVRALKDWRQKFSQVLLSFASGRKREKFMKLAAQDGIGPIMRYSPGQEGTFALVSAFNSGLELDWDKVLILGEEIIYPRTDKRQRKASAAFRGLDNFGDISPGDLLVHRDYGIGRYAGLTALTVGDVANDFLLLEYSGNDKLYVPADRLSLVQKFKGQEGIEPALDKLGTQSWQNGKERARKAIEKIAADLVRMYAYRKVAKGFRYHPPDELYHEFEATFAFEETPDQARAIQDVLEDMEKPQPMDRLVCGDVGFGKTEVALRAAFRAAAEGRQVALLCPTTVLAEQHYQTFRSRLAGFPVNVGLLSRFVPRAQQKETLKACEQGQIDILIGTHRLLSNDVKLPNLALLILDEEQRFGVRHKEKLKALKQNVDVLTLTATPIPRTLQLSMSGIRDLSIIETAPVDRKPVASAILERDDATLSQVIARELERQGQVFWVYNRVHDIGRVVEYVQKLAPTARIGIAHGQMPEKELEETMRRFWHGELDILVSTSIIESGLDFPRANTLIVDQAQMFGLGQLYQLRGRVGRSDRQAYAYLVVPDAKHLTDISAERLRVILNMDYLGAGFQVAMEDLRLRGAGNILGEAQSGHMTRVGLDLYLEMLEQEVHRMKGEPEPVAETEINLGVAAHIPQSYIEDGRERLRYYKALSSAPDAPAREEIALAMRDRFGQYPDEVSNFLAVLDFKQFLASLEVEKADILPGRISLSWRKNQSVIDPAQIAAGLQRHPEIKLAPPASLSLPLAVNAPVSEGLVMARGILEDALGAGEH
ncbi:MAG: transcription-repair coupling factor [Desulfovibrio sp.]|nr:transcription-repair coupling factor [Desulfovibrio sp.]